MRSVFEHCSLAFMLADVRYLALRQCDCSVKSGATTAHDALSVRPRHLAPIPFSASYSPAARSGYLCTAPPSGYVQSLGEILQLKSVY